MQIALICDMQTLNLVNTPQKLPNRSVKEGNRTVQGAMDFFVAQWLPKDYKSMNQFL